MPRRTCHTAPNEALHQEMAADPRIVVIGGTGGDGAEDAWGGAFGVTRGLLGAHGRGRVLDAPIDGSASVGAAARAGTR